MRIKKCCCCCFCFCCCFGCCYCCHWCCGCCCVVLGGDVVAVFRWCCCGSCCWWCCCCCCCWWWCYIAIVVVGVVSVWDKFPLFCVVGQKMSFLQDMAKCYNFTTWKKKSVCSGTAEGVIVQDDVNMEKRYLWETIT